MRRKTLRKQWKSSYPQQFNGGGGKYISFQEWLRMPKTQAYP